MEWIQNNKKALAIGAAIAATASILGYVLLKDDEKVANSQNDNQNEEEVTQEKTKHTVAPKKQQQPVQSSNNNDQQTLESLCAKIQVQYDQQVPDCITFNTIVSILEVSVEYTQNDYIQLIKQHRTERRSLTGEDYENTVIAQCEQIEALLNIQQEKMLQHLGISQMQFEQSLMFLIQKGLQQQIIQLDMAIKQQLKMKLGSDKTQDLDKAKEIIRFQNNQIKTNPDFFSNILIKLMNPEQSHKLPQVINILLCDKVYEEYQIEEEDIVKMLGEGAQHDQEIQHLMVQAEEEMKNIVMKIMPQNIFGQPPGY